MGPDLLASVDMDLRKMNKSCESNRRFYREIQADSSFQPPVTVIVFRRDSAGGLGREME